MAGTQGPKGKFVSRYKPVPPRKPIPMYTCAHCGVEFPRHQAMRQAGYCDACEFMTWSEVCKLLMCATETPLKLYNSGRLHRIDAAGCNLYHRAEVIHEDARRRAKKIGWSHLTHKSA